MNSTNHTQTIHPDNQDSVKIESLNSDGRGIARIGGKVTFVELALPGEEVAYYINKRHKKYDKAVATEIIKSSPDRITPHCQFFNVCGGCSLQHMNPLAQIKAKQQILADAFTHIGKVSPSYWMPAAVSSSPWGYRRKARLGVKLVEKKGGVLVGFREKNSAYITPLSHCLTLDHRLSKQLPALQKLISQLSCSDKIPQIEAAAGDYEVAYVIRHLADLNSNDLSLLRAFGETSGSQIYLQPAGLASINCYWPPKAHDLSYTLTRYNIKIVFKPFDFIQINNEINQQLVDQVVQLLELNQQDQVLDLFCGLGNFSLPIATQARSLLGIEFDDRLIAGANRNAEINKLSNASFSKANLFIEQATAPWSDFSFNKAVIDPPRTGAALAIKQLAAANIERIVYVSCNPATLARDSEQLVHHQGYELRYAGVFDMFPHTNHVESVSLFVKK